MGLYDFSTIICLLFIGCFCICYLLTEKINFMEAIKNTVLIVIPILCIIIILYYLCVKIPNKIEWINSVITFIVGLIAFIVYFLQKSSEKRDAAAILVMDIRHVEKIIRSISQNHMPINQRLETILAEYNWGKYKYLFARSFSEDDFILFNRFFSACVDLSHARNKLIELFYANLIAKAEIAQEKVLEAGLEECDYQKRSKIIKIIVEESFTLSLAEPIEHIKSTVMNMGILSNTLSFEKLKKFARM